MALFLDLALGYYAKIYDKLFIRAIEACFT